MSGGKTERKESKELGSTQAVQSVLRFHSLTQFRTKNSLDLGIAHVR